ncbi:protoporphyrinogen/coproporphyrinogen oxidase [Streptomyces chrestomyceticus]|uniref:protoporphyrinogen/coproporphyrinogen oxidase n=1 Tax=Streptomyces chrestomyceticus TaxID=68185 RepID=UPI003689953C
MSAQPRVVVVGGGIAGLSAAFRLQQAGCETVVLESAGPEMAGGRMATVNVSGFAVNRAATILIHSYRELIRLIAAAGLAGEVVPGGDLFGLVRGGRVDRVRLGSRRQLATGGLLTSFPLGDIGKLLRDYRRVRPLLTPHDMSPMAAADFESVHQYATRRGLRPETLEYLLDPLVSGLCLGEPEEVSAAMPFVFLDVILFGGGFFTSKEGVGFLPKGLARQLTVEYHAQVTSVEERGEEVAVTWHRPGEAEHLETAAACVLAVPPPQVPQLYGQLTADQREFLDDAPYARSIHVAFGLDRPTAERAMLVQASRVEHPDLCAFVLEHNLSPQRVPEGAGLVMTHLRGAWSDRNWDLGDDKVVDHVLAGVRRMGILPELERHTTMTHIWRVSPCLIGRRPGDYRAIARFAAGCDPRGRVQLAGGDILGHSTTNSSVASGERAARNLVARLRTEGTLTPERR